MDDLRLVRRNSAFSLFAIATRLVANTVLFVGIARIYGPVGFGQFTLAHVYFSIVLLFADFGYDFFLATEIGRNQSAGLSFAARIFPLKIIFSVAASLLMIVFALVSRSAEEDMWLMIIMALGIPSNALMLYAAAVLRGSQDVYPEARTAFIQSLLLLAVLLVLGILRLPLLYVVAAFVASRIYGMVSLLGVLRKRFPQLRLTLSPLRNGSQKELLVIGLTFGIHMICGTLYFQLDTILLGNLVGQYSVALYQSVMKLAAIMLVVNDVANMSFIPALARAHELEHRRWTRLGGLTSKLLVLLGGVSGLLFVLCPGEILNLVYGDNQFVAASDIMRIFGVILFIRFGMEPYAMMLTTAEMQRQRTMIVVAATILNLIANLAVIPRGGAIGAAWVALGTNFFVAASYAFALSSHLRQPFPLNNRGDGLILGTMTAVGLLLWYSGVVSLIVVLPILCVVALLLMMVAFSSDEQRTVWAFLHVRAT